MTNMVLAFIYPNSDKPQFHRGHTVVLGLLVFAWFMYVSISQRCGSY